MKILYLVSWYPRPGSQNSGVFFRQLAEGMAEKGNEVTVACVHVKFIGKIDKKGLDIRKRSRITEYMWFVPTLVPRCRSLYDFLGKRTMKKLLARINKEQGPFDVIHVQSAFSAAVYAMPYLKSCGIPVVYTEHSSKLLNGNLSQREKDTLHDLDRYASSHVAVSRYLADHMKNYVSDIQVIGNMIDTHPVPHDTDKFTFVSLGTLRKAKGLDLLITSFIREFSPDEPVRLLIGGEGEYETALKALIEEDAGRHDIQLCGAIRHEEVEQFYSKGNCFVLPSRYETFGIVYTEAMACGLPVIATRCGGPQELVNDENGILIDVDSQDQLQNALRQMFLHSADFDAAAISRNTLRIYEKRSICETYDALYNRIRHKPE